jgi:hypothetical protein
MVGIFSYQKAPFYRALEWKMLVNLRVIWNIDGHLVYFCHVFGSLTIKNLATLASVRGKKKSNEIKSELGLNRRKVGQNFLASGREGKKLPFQARLPDFSWSNKPKREKYTKLP